MKLKTRWIAAPLFLITTVLMGSAMCTAGVRDETAIRLAESRNGGASVNQWVIHYIACWNEHDAIKRRSLIAQTWGDAGMR